MSLIIAEVMFSAGEINGKAKRKPRTLKKIKETDKLDVPNEEANIDRSDLPSVWNMMQELFD